VAIDPTLKASMVTTMYYAAVSGRDGSGDPTGHAAPATMKVRLEEKHKLVKDRLGNEVVSNRQFTTEQAITIDDYLWLPGDDETDDNLARKPIAVGKALDATGGVSHYEVAL